MKFKRNQELINRVKTVLENPALADDERKAVQNLMDEYSYVTFDDWDGKSDFYKCAVESMVNDFGFDSKGLAKYMASNHPTLQQSYMRHCQDFIAEMAAKTYTDARNEDSVALAKALNEVSSNFGLPMI